jgi:histidinol-phosphatase (PHP family)
MFFDSHVHSVASPDSEMQPQDAIAAATKQGLGIAFTEHVDYVDDSERDPKATDAPRCLGDFVCDFERYPAEYKKFRGAGVSLGLEFGLTEALLPTNKRVSAGDYDFILGSAHFVDGVEIYHACAGNITAEAFRSASLHGETTPPPSAAPLRGGELFLRNLKTAPAECVRRYLDYSREMVELEDSAFFDSFGHIDYIGRYLPSLGAEFSYGSFPDEFDGLFRALARRDVAMEINTCLFTRAGAAETMLEICRRFAELGGRFCTVGSDAHSSGDLGRNFKDAREIAASANLAVVHFKERKPVRCG